MNTLALGPARRGKLSAGAWAEAATLLPVRDYKARHASTLLSFEAAAQAASEVEAKRRDVVPGRPS